MQEQRDTYGSAQQQAQWLLWQMGTVDVVPADAPAPLREEVRQAVQIPIIPHTRYDAVISRMKQAGQRTGAFTTCP